LCGELVHFSLFPLFDIGFSALQPTWIRLAGMLEAHGSLLFQDKGWSFWLSLNSEVGGGFIEIP
jgi:hypothetical protein